MNNIAQQVADTAQQVADYLRSLDIYLRYSYCGTKNLENWLCDTWLVTFVRAKIPVEQCDYHTGIGLRMRPGDYDAKLTRLEACTPQPTIEFKCLKEDLKSHSSKLAVIPKAADVVNSLLEDACGAGQSFESWCADYGYDDDSRKAYSMYETCKALKRKVNGIFKPDQVEHLERLLEDY